MVAKYLFGSMWWCLALVNARMLATGFEPMHARIKWIQPPNGEFVLSPISNSPLASALPQKLMIKELPESMSPSRIPYFSAKPDQTVIWEATGWCMEAAGNTNGAEVRINRCTRGPTQQWDFLLQTKQIQLKGTSSCLHANDEAGLNGAPIELRACDGVASWELLESDPLLKRTSLPYIRHAVMVFLSITALGLSLGAWCWKQLTKINHTIASIPSDMNHSGVSLSVLLAGQQGSGHSIPSLDLTQQKVVPAAMALRLNKIPHFEDRRAFGLFPIVIEDESDDFSKGLVPRSQVHKSESQLTIPHVEDPKEFGLTPIVVEEKNDDMGKGRGPRSHVQKSESHLTIPHFSDRKASGLTPITIEVENDDIGKGRGPRSHVQKSESRLTIPHFSDRKAFGLTPITIEDENDDIGKGRGPRSQVPKPEVRLKVPHFSDRKAFGLTPIVIEKEKEDMGMGRGPQSRVQRSESRRTIPHFEDRKAFGLTPIVIEDESDEFSKGLGPRSQVQNSESQLTIPQLQDPVEVGLTPLRIAIEDEKDDDDGSSAIADPSAAWAQTALQYGVEKARALKIAVDSFEADIKHVLQKDLNWWAFANDFRVIDKTDEVAMDLQTSQWVMYLVRAMSASFDVKESIEAKFSPTSYSGSNLRDTFVNTHSKIQFGNKEGSPFPYFWKEADPIEITMEASFHFNEGSLIDYMHIGELCVNGLPLNNFPKLSKLNDFAVNVQSMEAWMNGIKLHDLRPWWTPFASYLTNIRTVGEGNYAKVFLMDEICPPSTVPTTIAVKELIFDKGPKPMIRNEIEAMKSLGDFVRSDASIRHQKIGTVQDFSPYCEPLLAEPKEQDGRIYLVLPFYNVGSFEQIYQDPVKRQAFGGDRGMYALMLHVARGVKALHGAGWAHHDLHGENVMVSCVSGKSLAECHASVIDFGLATRLDGPGRGPRGMIHCQAPEMMTFVSSDKRKMDVWSLGMLLWEIRFGFEALPLENLSLDEAKKKLLTLDFKNLDHPALGGEPEIANLLSGMLTADPSDRWDLDRVIEELGKIAHPEMLGPHVSPLVSAGALSNKLAPASRDPPMACGVKVELIGMPKASKLNGQVGTIIHHDKSRKLYRVQMDDAYPWSHDTIVGESNVRLFH